MGFIGKYVQNLPQFSPSMQYAYRVNATGEWNRQSYLDGIALRETTTTQTDLAGRTVRMDYISKYI